MRDAVIVREIRIAAERYRDHVAEEQSLAHEVG